ncbi:HEAT repeat domain-containing protein [Chlamydia gallinacea]|uniref:HEAT repeat domain-containing protein n=1 Tax=Chlamydia gallinacea TaxID=1457153 RepID=A0ABS7ISL1_9CHLA|nr:HEAT repeat domain-containing protein [Chlamydia gallinacea]MBX6680433.1 HEAT repeat domain-containing protein [Chlamydia gallinacea]
MGSSRLIVTLGFLLSSSIVLGNFPESVSHRILYTSQKSIEQALTSYLDALDTHGEHDFRLLRTISVNCLKQGLYSPDPYIRKSTIVGAGLVGSSEALDILSQAMHTEDPLQQLLVLSAVSQHLGNAADELLFQALSSPYPVIRLEAAYRLAGRKNIKVIDHLHAFIHKLPEEIQCIASAIFLKLETEESDTYIRQLLASPKSSIRNYVTLLIGEYRQKRFLPTLRNLLTSASPLDREGALYALGLLKDGQSYHVIQQLSEHPHPDISLAAAQALLALGKEEEALPIFIKQIQEKRCHAIYTARLLSKELGTPLILPLFLTTSNLEVKFNAALALIHLGCTHPHLLDFMTEWLIQPHYSQVLLPTFSPGHATQAWKYRNLILPTNPGERAKALTTIQSTEEQILVSLLELPKEAYLAYIEKILKSQKTSLAAKAITFLSHSSHQHALEILQQASQLPGEPIIRAYAHLALYNLTKDPQYKFFLHHYAQRLITETLLFIDTEEEQPHPNSPYLRYQISPETRTKLMLDILESLVTSKNHEDIRLLIQLMTQIQAKNRHILAGLLMKIIE